MTVAKSTWITALIGCALYLVVTFALIEPAQFEGVKAVLAAQQKKTSLEEPSWNFRNPEFNQLVEELKREKEALLLREQQLHELQTRLAAERQELNTITQTVSQLQSEFDRHVIRIKDQEADNVKRQAKVLAGMSPETAADLANQMPEEDAVRILFTMKPDEASLVLEAMNKMGKTEAKRAATITERMRRALPADPTSRPRPSP